MGHIICWDATSILYMDFCTKCGIISQFTIVTSKQIVIFFCRPTSQCDNIALITRGALLSQGNIFYICMCNIFSHAVFNMSKNVYLLLEYQCLITNTKIHTNQNANHTINNPDTKIWQNSISHYPNSTNILTSKCPT